MVNMIAMINTTQLIVFWSLTSFLLLMLSSSFPRDQSAMEKELAKYAEAKILAINEIRVQDVINDLDIPVDESLISLEDRFSPFNATAAQESLYFIGDMIRGIGEEITQYSAPYDCIDTHNAKGVKIISNIT